MILGLQIIAIIFAFTLIYFALLHNRKGNLDRGEMLSWIIIWTGVIFITIFPELLREFSQAFFITRLFDLMVVGGFILVIIMLFRIYVRTKILEKKMEEYVRKEALKDLKKKKRAS